MRKSKSQDKQRNKEQNEKIARIQKKAEIQGNRKGDRIKEQD